MQCSPKLKRCCAISGGSSRAHGNPISVIDFSQQSGNNACNAWERKTYLLSPALLATSRSRRIWRTQRLGLGKPGSSLVRALAISVAFSTAILFAGTTPIVADPVQHHFGQLELHLQSPSLQPLEPLQPLQRSAHVEPKQWKPKEWVAPVLDKIAVVKVDSDTEDEYWVFDKLPFLGQLYVLRKQTTALEIVLSGFVAGFLVELTNALLLHPIDTLKTRLQRGTGLAAPDPSLLYQRLYDGLIPVLATVPALSIFWAVKDIVRKTLIVAIRAKLPLPVADVISSTFASACGEAAYVAVKTPGEVLKIKQQAAVLDEDALRQRYSSEDNSYSSQSFRSNPGALLEDASDSVENRTLSTCCHVAVVVVSGMDLSEYKRSKNVRLKIGVGCRPLFVSTWNPAIFPYISHISMSQKPSAGAGKFAKLSHPLQRGCTAGGHPHGGLCSFARLRSISQWCWFWSSEWPHFNGLV